MTSSANPASTLRSIEIDGRSIACRVVGDGPPMLLLHGWPLDGGSFDAVVEDLSHRCRCIVPDLPGAGGSPAGRTVPSPRAQARLVAGMLESLGTGPVVAVGNDSGGMTARWLAADRPDLVRALVLLNTELPGRRAPHQRSQRLLARWLPGYGGIARRLMRGPAFLASPRGFGGTLADHDLLQGTFRQRWIDPLTTDRERMDAARRTFVGVLDWRELDLLAEAHRAIVAPVWLVWGEDDPTFPLEHAREMSVGFPDLRGIAVVPRARLYVHLDQPQAVLHELEKALDELKAAERGVRPLQSVPGDTRALRASAAPGAAGSAPA